MLLDSNLRILWFMTRIAHDVTIVYILPEKCDAGQYRDGTVTVCTQCPVNTVSDQSGVAFCVSCGVGKVSNEQKTACGQSTSLYYTVFY